MGGAAVYPHDGQCLKSVLLEQRDRGQETRVVAGNAREWAGDDEQDSVPERRE